MIECSWVFPCFNEAGNLPWLLERLEVAFEGRGDVEVIFVDNGSIDGTAALLDVALPALRVSWKRVDVTENRGYGHGVCAGLAHATGTYVGWSHADGQVDPGVLLEAMARLEGPQMYIKGRRLGRSLGERVFSWGHTMCARLLLEPGLTLQEINAPPNLFHRAHHEAWEAPPLGHQLELYAFVMAQRGGARVRYVDVPWEARRAGRSSWYSGLGSRAWLARETLTYLLELRRASVGHFLAGAAFEGTNL